MTRVLLIVGTVALLTACNRGSTPEFALPTPPTSTPTAPQTVYMGTTTDSIGGAGSLTVSLGTTGSIVAGTWLATFPGTGGSTRVISGTLSGTSYGATVADCTESDFVCVPDCQQAFTGTLTSNGLSGTYAEVPGDTCTAHSGSVSATRQ